MDIVLVKEKSAQIINTLNEISHFDHLDISIELLSGVSNQTFKCFLDSNNTLTSNKLKEIEQDTSQLLLNQPVDLLFNKKGLEIATKDASCSDHRAIINREIIFKVFGKIGEIVDRELEYKIINGLSKFQLGPKLLSTDNTNFRAEEFLQNCRNISHSELLEERYLDQIIHTFILINSFGDEKRYYKYINAFDKQEFYKFLLTDNTSNIYNFTKRMRDLAYISLNEFENELSLDKDFWLEPNFNTLTDQIKSIRNKLNSSIETMINLAPNYPILVLSHNDGHSANILIQDDRKLLLIDHEFCSYNYLGFDIANYLFETNFKYDFNKNKKEFFGYEVYFKKEYLLVYQTYIKKYFAKNSDKLNCLDPNLSLSFLEELYLQKSFYFNYLSFISIYWFIFAIAYLKYSKFKLKSEYDYFNYSLLYYSVFEYINKDHLLSKKL